MRQCDDDNLRVAMVTGSYPPDRCGIGDYSGRLTVELSRLGVDVRVITTRSSERRCGGHVRDVVRRWDFAGLQTAWETVESVDPDVVHVQYPGRSYGHRPEPALLSWLGRARPVAPVLVTLHEFGISHPLRKCAVLALSSGARRLIMAAESERAALSRYYPPARNKTDLIPIGSVIPVVPRERIDRAAVRQEVGLSENAFVISHFGFVQPNKGVDDLLRALAAVRSLAPETRLLMIAGCDPQRNPHHRDLCDLTAELGLERHVTWTGYRSAEEVSALLHASDVCALPYTDGATPRRTTLIAACQHGLPVVTTWTSSKPLGPLVLPSIAPDRQLHREPVLSSIRVDETMLLRPARSPELLAEALLALHRDESLRRVVGKTAARWARQFEWPVIARRTLEVYRRLAATS